MKNETKWNINLQNKTSNTEPFLVTSNYQQPLLQTLSFSKPSFSPELPYPVSSTTIEPMGNRGDRGDRSNKSRIPTKEEIDKMNKKAKAEMCKSCNTKPVEIQPRPEPGKDRYVDSTNPTNPYSIKIYNKNTYLNGFNCNDGGCDMSGVDIFVNWVNCKGGGCDMSGIDINESESTNIKFNTPNKVYFRDGGSKMFDANKIDLNGVTFGGNVFTKYLNNLNESINSISRGKFDISAGSYFPPDNTKVNYFNKNPFQTRPTVRTNPLSTNHLNTPIGSIEPLANKESEGTNTLNFKSDGDSRKDFLTLWKTKVVPFIIKYNGVALINEGVVYVFNKFFIELFNGNFQTNAYMTVLTNYYIFIGYLICIFVTYNFFYRSIYIFIKKNNSESNDQEENNETTTQGNIISSIVAGIRLIFFPVNFLMTLYEFINDLRKLVLSTNNNVMILYKFIFVALFLLILYLVLYLKIPYYLSEAFLNSLRFGKDEKGKIDIFTHYTMIVISLFGIYVLFNEISKPPDINMPDPRGQAAITVVWLFLLLLGFLFRFIISISITWFTVFVICIIIVFYTLIPPLWLNFGIIHEIDKYFDNTYDINYNSKQDISSETEHIESTELRTFSMVVDFIYKYIFQFGLIGVFIIQIINYSKNIKNEYSLFKAMLLSACCFFIFICFLFFTDKIKKSLSRNIGMFLTVCSVIILITFFYSSIIITIEFFKTLI